MENQTVPTLRFANFTDDWNQCKFQDAFKMLQNNTLPRSELDFYSGVGRNIHYGDILVKYGECMKDISSLPFIKDISIINKFSASLLQTGDVIMADTAEDESVGKCTEILDIQGENVLSGLHTIPCHPRGEYASAYLGYFMNSPSYHDQLRPFMQGIKVTSISRSALQDTVIFSPCSLDEQGMIGEFFLAFDHLLSLQERKYLSLLNIKKSMLKKMFPQDGAKVPSVRFAGFTDDWEKRKMGEIVDRYEDPVPTPHEGYIRLGIRSYAKGTFYSYVEKGNELETAQMHRVATGNFIVNITFGWEHAVAITSENDDGKLVSHRFPQFKFRDGFVPNFFKYVIVDENFRHHLWLSSPGGAGRNRVLNISEMLEYEMFYPCKEEQMQIADFFSNLDKLIALQEHKNEYLHNIKKSCLEKMFI